jgi:hypothetical protein
MKELLTEWRKFVNESYSAEFSEEDIPGTSLAADTIRDAIDGGTQIEYDRYEGSSWSREVGTVSAKARQLKRSFQGVDDPVQLADDMATFGEWIEKSFQKWVEEGQDEEAGELLAKRILTVGRSPESLRQFAPILHKF